MGPSLFYPWLPWFCIYTATRWNAALPSQSPALSPGTTSRARWFSAALVCRAHWSLSLLSVACTVSREEHDAETTPGQCRVVANRLLTAHLLFHVLRWTSTTSCSCALARLATVQHPANLAQGRSQPNHLRGKPLTVFTVTHHRVHGEEIHPG